MLGRLPIERQIMEAHKEENLKDEGGLQDAIPIGQLYQALVVIDYSYLLLKEEKKHIYPQINQFISINLNVNSRRRKKCSQIILHLC